MQSPLGRYFMAIVILCMKFLVALTHRLPFECLSHFGVNWYRIPSAGFTGRRVEGPHVCVRQPMRWRLWGNSVLAQLRRQSEEC